MEIWLRDEKTGIECGINDYGELFLGNDESGTNLCDTPDNRNRVIDTFCKYTGRQKPVIAANGAPIKFNGSLVEFSR